MLGSPVIVHPDEVEANKRKLAFLEMYAKTPNVYRICTELGISRNLVYNIWPSTDEEFKRRWDEIRESQIDGIEGNLIEKALTDSGAVTQQIFALKTRRSEIYGDKALGPVSVTYNLNGLSQDLLDKAKEVLKLGAAVEITQERSEPINDPQANGDTNTSPSQATSGESSNEVR